LNPKRERKRKWRGVVRDTTFNEEKEIFPTMKVPRQCPLVLLVKVG
jgi:hypothetical protein